MQSKWKVAVALAAIIATSVVVYVVSTRPPVVPSEEVDRRWAQVHKWSGVEGAIGVPAFGDLPQPLARSEVAEAVLEDRGEATSVIALDTLPTDYRAQLDRLLAWGEAPRFEGRCGDQTVGAIEIWNRLRVALAAAAAADIERAKAVLRVANALRTRGALLQTMVGTNLVYEVAKWAKSRDVPPWPALKASAPDAEGYIRAMAREAICASELVVGAAGDNPALMLHLEVFKLDAHARLAPMQIPAPTFETLRPLIKPQPDEPDPINVVLQVDHANMLEKFEESAKRLGKLLGEGQ